MTIHQPQSLWDQGRFPIEYRVRMPRGDQVIYYVLGAMMLSAPGVVLVIMWRDWSSGDARYLAALGILVLLSGPMTLWILRILFIQRPRVTLDARGLTHVGAFRSTRVDWEEIESQTLINVWATPEQGQDHLVLALKGRARRWWRRTLTIELGNFAPTPLPLPLEIEYATGLPARTRGTPAHELRGRQHGEGA